MGTTNKRVTKYAGFWLRTLAYILDAIWLYGLMYFIIYFVTTNQVLSTDSDAYSSFYFTFEFIIPAIIVILFWVKFCATPGKMLLKIKIVDADTLQSPGSIKFIIRYVSYIVSVLPFCLGFFWIAFDKRKQGFHDKIASTVVIKT